MSIDTMTPAQARKSFANSEGFKQPTNGICDGFVQANLTIVPSDVAESFAKFCSLNQSCCPLLFKSKAGQTDAPPLADESDIRKDCPAYRIYKDGIMSEVVPDLTNEPFSDLVTFYLGCSFSFHEKLKAVGIEERNSMQNKAVSMFDTSIHCHPVNRFDCNMVCSMRAVTKDKLVAFVDACKDMDYCHGAPIHIGWPEKIGIKCISRPEFGETTELKDGEVPVFHACGVTAMLALRAAALPCAFTHYPASMFITDVPSNDNVPSLLPSMHYPPCTVVCLNPATEYYSILSKTAEKSVSEIERTCLHDPSARGIQHIYVEGDLLKAALSLSQDARAVAITTGFPCIVDRDPPEENDGIAGALCIAKAVQALGKSVTFVVDDHFVDVMKTVVHWCHKMGHLTHEASIVSYSKETEDGVDAFLYDPITKTERFSHLVAIERSSRNADGKCCTMNARDITARCDDIDAMFIHAENTNDIVTVGIGDGGNELGMGKVKDLVEEHVPRGKEIACKTASDHLISAGVSNWGGYGLAAAIFKVISCPLHERYRRKGIGRLVTPDLDDFLPTVEKEHEIHEYLMSVGLRDGITGKLAMTVDNLPFYPTHADVLQKLRQIASAPLELD